MSRAPGAIDFAASWRDWLEGAADPRLDPGADLAYWERVASECDDWQQPCTRTLAAIEQMILPGETLLDVGACTGRFALELAAKCASVTALDQSAAVLEVLRSKATQRRISNIQTVATTWESARVEPHDVVLAAWSLYRELDLDSCLRRLMNATGRLLVIVAPDADASQMRRGETAAYLYVLGALRALGAMAELTIIDEPQPGSTGVPVATVPVPIITWRRPAPCTEAHS